MVGFLCSDWNQKWKVLNFVTPKFFFFKQQLTIITFHKKKKEKSIIERKMSLKHEYLTII